MCSFTRGATSSEAQQDSERQQTPARHNRETREQRAPHATRRATARARQREEDPEASAAINLREAQIRAANRARPQEQHPEAAVAATSRATQLRAAARARLREQNPEAAMAAKARATQLRAASRARLRQEDPEARLPRTHGNALGLENVVGFIPFDLGPMDVICTSCSARHFRKETVGVGGRFQRCCEVGRVVLPALQDMPMELKRLFGSDLATSVGEDQEAIARRVHFLKHIRLYNGAMAFASIVCKMELFRGRGPPLYKGQGQMYHYIAPVHPPPHRSPSFGQLYFVDTEKAVEHQMQKGMEGTNHTPLREDILGILHHIIRRVNPYASGQD